MTTKIFPIKAECTKCGHSGDIFVSDERVASAMQTYVKERIAHVWQPLLVRRMVISWVLVFLLGVTVGSLATRFTHRGEATCTTLPQ
ncbi:hypothetical protein [Methylobacter sp.]|uniref:hypothetical protein n=1 Tax=Methylobacter sp. TaxID=2051955 RepID=UPI001211BD7F|nr:hypothetical protein [Methylobacter sp.]TAK59529.1 MAG: hypothetical protein EPO18_20420 [Methylobacter sp.]